MLHSLARFVGCLLLCSGLLQTTLMAQDIPKGDIVKYTFEQSKIFPGTSREVSIYIPKQYDPAKPACVYVNQDGIQYKAPDVFDELISKREMPITIGVFVTPGIVKPTSDAALPRFNRSFEYDGLGDGYARFLLEELLPERKELGLGFTDRVLACVSGGARVLEVVARGRAVLEANVLIAKLDLGAPSFEPSARADAVIDGEAVTLTISRGLGKSRL